MSQRLFFVSACFLFAFSDMALAARQRTVSDLFEDVKSPVVVIHMVERQVAEEDDKSGEVSLPGLGSGVLISKDGLITTAAHVVQTADDLAVEFESGETGGAVLRSRPGNVGARRRQRSGPARSRSPPRARC